MRNFFSADHIRLSADIQTYIQELRLHFPDMDKLVRDAEKKPLRGGHDVDESGDDPEKNKYIIAALLAKALFEVQKGKKEIAWRALNKAKQIEIMCMKDKDQLVALARKFYNEADKLSNNRKNTVLGIFSYLKEEKDKDKNKDKRSLDEVNIHKLRIDVFMAAKIIGEHFDNEGFKVMIRTRNFNLFNYMLISLLIVIPVGFSLGYFFLATGTKASESHKAIDLLSEILSVELLGALGAVFSVVISYTRSHFKGTIPQQKLVFAVTRLRPLIGAASALALYILIKAGLLMGDNYDNALFALAFVSGFSERFIVNKLEDIANPDKQDKPSETKTEEKAE